MSSTILAKSTSPKGYPNCLPDSILQLQAGYLKDRDIRILACVNKLLESNFSRKGAYFPKALLAQVRCLTELRSMDTLIRHMKDLQTFCPKEKPWTMAQVLGQYDLRSIDFDNEKPEKLIELMKLFKELEAFPNRERTPYELAERSADFSTDQIILALSESSLREFAAQVGHFPSNAPGDAPREPLRKLQNDVTAILYNKDRLETAHLFNQFLSSKFPNQKFLEKPRWIDICGKIERFRLGISRFSAGFETLGPFIESFCPRLKEFQVNFGQDVSSKNQAVLFFLHTERKHTLTYFKTYNFGNNNFLTVEEHQFYSSQNNLESTTDTPLPISIADNTLGKCTKLRHVRLVCPPQDEVVGDWGNSFQSFWEKRPKIRSADLLGLTDTHVRAIPGKIENLTELTLWSKFHNPLYQFSDEGIITFLSKCKNIRSLNFNLTLENNTKKLFFSLPEILPNLEEIHFTGDIKPDFKNVAVLIIGCPKLVFITFNSIQMLSEITCLREINRCIQRDEFPDRKYLMNLNQFSQKTLYSNLVEYISWYFDVTPAESEKILEKDMRVLKSCVKPLYAPSGNVFEQLASNYLNRREFALDPANLKNPLRHKLRIEAFSALMQDPSATQKQLLYRYNLLGPEIQQRFKDRLKADAEADKDTMIKQDVRCLQASVKDHILMLMLPNFSASLT